MNDNVSNLAQRCDGLQVTSSPIRERFDTFNSHVFPRIDIPWVLDMILFESIEKGVHQDDVVEKFCGTLPALDLCLQLCDPLVQLCDLSVLRGVLCLQLCDLSVLRGVLCLQLCDLSVLPLDPLGLLVDCHVLRGVLFL